MKCRDKLKISSKLCILPDLAMEIYISHGNLPTLDSSLSNSLTRIIMRYESWVRYWDTSTTWKSIQNIKVSYYRKKTKTYFFRKKPVDNSFFWMLTESLFHLFHIYHNVKQFFYKFLKFLKRFCFPKFELQTFGFLSIIGRATTYYFTYMSNNEMESTTT